MNRPIPSSNNRARRVEKMAPRNTNTTSTTALLRPVRAGFPTSVRTKLRYVTSFQVYHSGTGAGVRAFAANGLYDPDITSTGHQPMGFDIFSQVYERYLVLSSTFKVYVTAPSAAANTAPIAIGAMISNVDTLAYPFTDALMEQGLSEYKLMACNSPIYTGGRYVIGRVFDPVSFFACKDPKDLQDTIGATTSANPSLLCYHLLWYGQTPSGSDLVSMNVTVELQYEVVFDVLRQIAQS